MLTKGQMVWVLPAILGQVLCGCRPNSTASSKVPPKYTYVDSDAQPVKGSTSKNSIQAPTQFDPSMAGPESTDNPSLESLQATQKKAAAALKANPKSDSAKKAFVVATDRLALATMIDPKLDRTVKYKQALELYRAALAVDPKDKEAQSNSQLIIRIYHQLNKPVP